MSRILSAAVLISLATACAQGTVYIDSPNADGPGDPAIVEEPVVQGTDDCSAFVTPGHNACDGHEDFSLELVSLEDADGDGVWSVGEQMTVTVSLQSTVDNMWYPGILARSSTTVTGLPPENDGYWFYGILAEQPYDTPFVLTIDEVPESGEVELVFTTGAISCDSELGCPHPSPLVVTVPVR